MKSFFGKFKEGLRRSTPTFYKAFGKVGGLFGAKQIDAATLDELEEALYMADFGVETTEEVLEAIRQGMDTLGRPGFRWRSVAVNGYFPDYLRQNSDRFANLIAPNATHEISLETVPDVAAIILTPVGGSGS